jgi:hypothetical protein
VECLTIIYIYHGAINYLSALLRMETGNLIHALLEMVGFKPD